MEQEEYETEQKQRERRVDSQIERLIDDFADPNAEFDNEYCLANATVLQALVDWKMLKLLEKDYPKEEGF